MAKVSSSKKVARVARSGGSKRRVRERPKVGFGLAIFVIIVLGSLTVFYARSERASVASAAEAPAANKDHWHVATGVYVCDHFLPPVSDKGEDKNGIHTHNDGIIHTHPFNASASGSKARYKVFAEQIGMKTGTDSFTMPDGTEYKNGYDCNGKPAKVYLYRWPAALDPQSTAEVFDKNFGDVRLKDDRSAITLAVVPEGTEVPRPDTINTLNNLSDVDGGAAGAAGAGQGVPGADPATGLPPGVSIPGQATPGAATPDAATPGAATPGAATPGANPATPAPSTPAVPAPSTPAVPAPSTPAAPASTP